MRGLRDQILVDKARGLRNEGNSIKEIAQALNINKSTAWGYTNDIKLTEEQVLRLYRKQEKCRADFVAKYAKRTKRDAKRISVANSTTPLVVPFKKQSKPVKDKALSFAERLAQIKEIAHKLKGGNNYGI